MKPPEDAQKELEEQSCCNCRRQFGCKVLPLGFAQCCSYLELPFILLNAFCIIFEQCTSARSNLECIVPKHVLRPFFSLRWSSLKLCWKKLRMINKYDNSLIEHFMGEVKSDNLKHITMAWWLAWTNDSSTKCLMFQAFFFHNFL